MGQLIGGIKNALERGESLEKAKQSFINAGYSPKEVSDAIAELSQRPQQTIQQPLSQPKQIEIKLLPQTPQPKKPHRWMIIMMIILVLLILIGAAILGFYFDRIINFLFG